LYLQVAQALKEGIVSGTYPVGSKLPTEEQLCARFSVSRHTVREALRLLRDDGLVASRKRAGTVVLAPRATGADIHHVMSINDLLAFSASTRREIESIRTVRIEPETAARTGLAEGSEWLRARAYQYAVGVDVPVCWTEYYVARDYAAVGRLLQRHQGPVFPLLEDLFGINIVEVDQQISACLVSPVRAAALGVEEGSAALEVRRTYKTADGRIAQVTINTHPAERFQHSMSMRRVKG